MNKEVGRRFSKARKSTGMTQKELAAELRTEQTIVSRTETGLLRVSEEMTKWAFNKGIDLNWLFMGQGVMFRDEKAELKKELTEAVNLINQAIKQL